MNEMGTGQARLGELMDGFLTTQLLYVAAKLRVADELADGPRTSDDLAGELGVQADALHRVLRGLAVQGVFEELDGRKFGLTPLGEHLREDAPASLRGMIVARGQIYYGAVGGLLNGVRTGESPFEAAHGKSLFEYLAERPDEMALFQDSMTGRSGQEAAAVAAAYDFGRFQQVVDVAGGHGILLTAVLRSVPGVNGVLFDQPDVVAKATLPDRARAVAGDFFHEIPAGGDAYLLSRIIHDWDDDDAVRILQGCRRAMADTGTLLLVETVLPRRAADNPAAVRLDLLMFGLLRGRERTEEQHAALLAAAGFELTKIIPTGAPTGAHIIEARPSAT